MEKPNDIKRDSISVNYFLNTAAYSGLFSLLSVILTGQVSAASSLYVGLALGILSLFSRGSTVFIGSLIERFSTVSLTETGFGFMVFHFCCYNRQWVVLSASFLRIWLCWDSVFHWLILPYEGISSPQ